MCSKPEMEVVQNWQFISTAIQVALLWQRDRATCLSVEIPIVWHYLRDPTFSRFYTMPECDRHTHTQTDGQIHDDGTYCVSIASRGKNRPYCTCPTKYNYYATSVG